MQFVGLAQEIFGKWISKRTVLVFYIIVNFTWPPNIWFFLKKNLH